MQIFIYITQNKINRPNLSLKSDAPIKVKLHNFDSDFNKPRSKDVKHDSIEIPSSSILLKEVKELIFPVQCYQIAYNGILAICLSSDMQ